MLTPTSRKMSEDELRYLVERQEEAIRAYQGMVFTKDDVIEAWETLYFRTKNMEKARIEYEVKTANLRFFDDRMEEKYCGEAVCNCEAKEECCNG